MTDKQYRFLPLTLLGQEHLDSDLKQILLKNPDLLTYYRLAASSSYQGMTVKSDDWSHIQRAALLGDEVLGYLEASVDRDLRTITHIGMLPSFETFNQNKGHLLMRAASVWMDELRTKFLSLTWTAVEGNPLIPAYELYTQRRNGVVTPIWNMARINDSHEIVDGLTFQVRGLIQ